LRERRTSPDIAGDTANAKALINLTWGQMIDPASPFYTGTFWENTLSVQAPASQRRRHTT
jgi:hypothetical protein